jgi:hypothetical protein
MCHKAHAIVPALLKSLVLYGSAASPRENSQSPQAFRIRPERRDPAAGQAAGDSPRPHLRRTRRHVLLSVFFSSSIGWIIAWICLVPIWIVVARSIPLLDKEFPPFLWEKRRDQGKGIALNWTGDLLNFIRDEINLRNSRCVGVDMVFSGHDLQRHLDLSRAYSELTSTSSRFQPISGNVLSSHLICSHDATLLDWLYYTRNSQ